MHTDLNPQRVIRTGDCVEKDGVHYKVHYVVEKNGQTSLEALLGKTREILVVHKGKLTIMKPGQFKFVK